MMTGEYYLAADVFLNMEFGLWEYMIWNSDNSNTCLATNLVQIFYSTCAEAHCKLVKGQKDNEDTAQNPPSIP